MLFLSNALSSIEGKFLFPVHFWSLSVEQQFYLFWPFLLLITGRRQLIWACAAMVAISPFSRWYFAEVLQNMPASYYSLMSNLIAWPPVPWWQLLSAIALQPPTLR